MDNDVIEKEARKATEILIEEFKDVWDISLQTFSSSPNLIV